MEIRGLPIPAANPDVEVADSAAILSLMCVLLWGMRACGSCDTSVPCQGTGARRSYTAISGQGRARDAVETVANPDLMNRRERRRLHAQRDWHRADKHAVAVGDAGSADLIAVTCLMPSRLRVVPSPRQRERRRLHWRRAWAGRERPTPLRDVGCPDRCLGRQHSCR